MKTKFRTDELAIDFYRQCEKIKVKGPFKDQMMKASSSIPLNLMEGSAKPTFKDRLRFYFIALGSLREMQAIIELLNLEVLREPANILGAHLYNLYHQRPPPKN